MPTALPTVGRWAPTNESGLVVEELEQVSLDRCHVARAQHLVRGFEGWAVTPETVLHFEVIASRP